MSTSTGIKGGEYLINQETVKEIKKYNIQKDTIEKLENAGYSINEEGLKIVSEKYKESLSNEIKSLYFGEKFSNRKDLERALKKLKKHVIEKKSLKYLKNQLLMKGLIASLFLRKI